jgi:hypothetical protein
MKNIAISTMVLSASFLLGSCTYNAQVQDAPSYNLVTNYDNKIDGLWLLYIDSTGLQRPLKPSSYVCAAHKFPISATGPFETSVRQTLSNVFDQVETVNAPVSGADIRSRGARGFIVVRGEEVRAKLDAKPGMWTASMEGQATLVASVAVNGPTGRVMGTTFEGSSVKEADAGAMCAGGAVALGEAVTEAMRDAMRKMGEALSNSERVRGVR